MGRSLWYVYLSVEDKKCTFADALLDQYVSETHPVGSSHSKLFKTSKEPLVWLSCACFCQCLVTGNALLPTLPKRSRFFGQETLCWWPRSKPTRQRPLYRNSSTVRITTIVAWLLLLLLLLSSSSCFLVRFVDLQQKSNAKRNSNLGRPIPLMTKLCHGTVKVRKISS